MLNHEIGTHYVRKHNDKLQVWNCARKKYNLKRDINTEEGMASLAQLYTTACKEDGFASLLQPALNYYSAFLASKLSFRDLYAELQEFISDPCKLWRQCVRVKRGISDTSKCGGMFKDQAYFIGCVKILTSRSKINFQNIYSAKLSLKDSFKPSILRLLEKEKCIYPYFLADIAEFKRVMDKIAQSNFIE